MNIDTAISELSLVLGDRLSRSKSDLANHGQSEAYFRPAAPDAVAYPRSTQEVSEIVTICARNKCPVIPWGTGTSIEGHSLAIKGGVTVDFSRMNKVLAINAADMDCLVQPGVTRQDLNHELRATGLFFPVDPGANAALGGMVGTRASGTTAVRYGTMKQNVLALEAVLADGRIIRTGTRARKSSAGYDLTSLLVGSEGTLALITEITLRLFGKPEAISAAICSFETVGDAVNTVIATTQMGIPMARIELMDAKSAIACNNYSNMNLAESPHLLIEFHGSENSVKEDATRFGDLTANFGGADFKWSIREQERNRLWKMRHDAYYAILASQPGRVGFVTDICVPISRLAEAIDETQSDIDASPIDGPILSHAGDGNFHATLLIRKDDGDDLKVARDLAHRMAERALRLGGTVTGEHGVGIGKLDLMAQEHGEAWQVMGEIKRALDPDLILNPGKLVSLN